MSSSVQKIPGHDKTATTSIRMETPSADPVHIMDRKAPAWALILGSIFSVGVFFCLASVAIFAIFFQTLVVGRGEDILAPLLMMVAVVPMLGIVVLEYAHNKILSGYRHIRELNARRARAAAGVFVFATLVFLHPLAGVGILAGSIGGLLFLWILSRLKRREPMWDFIAQEAVPILSGRDFHGLEIATQPAPEHPLAGAVQMAMMGISVLSALSTSTWLVSNEVLAPAAVLAVSLLSLWSTDAILGYIRQFLKTPPLLDRATSHVNAVPGSIEDDDFAGLLIKNLSVFSDDGKILISDLNLKAAPGSITGIMGDSGAGKSLLLRSIIDPFSLSGLEIHGNVRVNCHDLWHRDGQPHSLPATYLSDNPIILPTSGHQNLSCFHGNQVLERGRRILEKMVFSSELAEKICAHKNAETLPGMQKKMLAASRAFLLSPDLYLIDGPEDGLPEKQISMLLAQLKQETKLGRTVLLVTQNRALAEACDTLIIMQEGRIIDEGTSAEVRTRQAAGWARFVGERNLNIDENLETWVRSHFKRPGDEMNRRKVCHIASEMLAHSCQSRNALVQQSVTFEFKHYEGYCEISIQDSDPPISAAQLDKARQSIEDPDGDSRLTPLALIIGSSLSVDASSELDQRKILVKVATIDPRKKARASQGKGTNIKNG